MSRKRSASRPMSLDQALVTVLVTAANANQHVSPQEAERAYHIIWFMRRFRSRSGAAIDRLVLAVRDRLEAEGEDEVLRQAARALPARLRAPSFAVAADLMLADGRLERAERAFLKALASALKLKPAAADEILRVIRIKNGA
jgi:tellurite resistance protein